MFLSLSGLMFSTWDSALHKEHEVELTLIVCSHLEGGINNNCLSFNSGAPTPKAGWPLAGLGVPRSALVPMHIWKLGSSPSSCGSEASGLSLMFLMCMQDKVTESTQLNKQLGDKGIQGDSVTGKKHVPQTTKRLPILAACVLSHG